MKITLSGLKAWIVMLIVFALVIVFLVFLFNLILLLLPFVIVIGVLIWLFSLFKRKKKKGYVDVEFRVK